jgi:hypothetical protein
MKVKRTAAEIEQMRQNFGVAMEQPQGRGRIAQTMIEPFKKGRDYVGIVRQVMYVHHVPQGAQMEYDLDPQFSAVVIAPRGAVPYEEVHKDRIRLDPFIIAVYPKVHATDVPVSRFDILNRSQQKAQHKMAELEDSKGFAAFHYASLTASDKNPLTTNAGGGYPAGLCRGMLADAFSYPEAYDAPVANVIMHSAQYRDLREWTTQQWDPVTNRALIKTGYVGDMWGAQFRVSKMQTVGTVNVLADPQFLGVISIRTDLSSMDAPDHVNLQFGWVLYEYLGMAQLVTIGSAEVQVQGKYLAPQE